MGDKYTKALSTTVLDKNGKSLSPLMGCYGIGVSRILGAAIEQSHDEKGIVWQKNISPFDVHFISIAKSEEVISVAESVYETLINAGLEVVYDDRKVGPGFKFKDADLLGVPLQLVLGERDFKASNTLNIINRKTGEKHSVELSSVIDRLNEMRKNL